MSKAKAKGTAAETAVVRYLAGLTWSGGTKLFPHVERRALNGTLDRGDIAGIPGVVIEVKAAERLALAAWQRETLTEMANANADFGLLVVKRKYKPIHQWDAYMPAVQAGVLGAFLPEGEAWIRMDFGLAAGHLALRL